MFGIVNKPQFSENELTVGGSYDLVIGTYREEYTGYGSGQPYTVPAVLVHVEPFKLCFAVMKPISEREGLDLHELEYSDEDISVATFMDLKTITINDILNKDIEIKKAD